MPPEALDENPKYSTTLDVFSLGHLALYTVVRDFPFPTAPTQPDPKRPGELVARSETERRSRQVEQSWKQLGKGHPLVQLVTHCLQNDPRQRPTARWVLQELERMKAKVKPGPYESMSKLEMIAALRENEGRLDTGSSNALKTQVGQLQV